MQTAVPASQPLTLTLILHSLLLMFMWHRLQACACPCVPPKYAQTARTPAASFRWVCCELKSEKRQPVCICIPASSVSQAARTLQCIGFSLHYVRLCHSIYPHKSSAFSLTEHALSPSLTHSLTTVQVDGEPWQQRVSGMKDKDPLVVSVCVCVYPCVCVRVCALCVCVVCVCAFFSL